MPKPTIAILAAVLLATPLRAQRLDLGPPEPPDVGERSVLTELGRALDVSIADLERERRALEASGAAPDSPMLLSVRLRIAARLVALRLAEDRDSTRSVSDGLALVAALDRIDRLGQAAAERASSAATTAERETAQLSLLIAAQRWEAAHAESAAPLADALDELRPLLDDPGSPLDTAWPPAIEAPSVDLGGLESRIRALPGPSAGRAIETHALVVSAIQSERYRALALGAADTLARALHAREIILADPRLTPPAGALAEAIGSAAERLRDRAQRAGALSELEDLAALGEIARRAAVLAERRVDVDEAVDFTRGMLSRLGSLDEPARDALDAASRVLEIAETRPTAAPGDRPTPQLRRGWRELVLLYQDAERRAIELLPALAEDPSLLSSPATVTTIRRHQRTADDLRVVVRAGEVAVAIRKEEATTSVAADKIVRAGVAGQIDRFLRLLGEERYRERVVAEFRTFLTHYDQLGSLPGEEMLRAGDQRLEPILRGRQPDAAARIDRDRRDWLVAWTSGDEAAGEFARARLALDARCLAAIADVASVASLDALERLDRWAAIELPPRGVAALRSRLEPIGREISEALLAGDIGAIEAALDRWDRLGPLARLIAGLDRLAASRPDWPTNTGAASVIAQLGSDPPAGALLADHLDALAAIGPWLLEMAHADERDDRPMGDAILEYLNETIENALADLERSPAIVRP